MNVGHPGGYPGKTGIVLQARSGSKRLPGKMLLPFHQKKTLLELMVEKLLQSGLRAGIPVIVATSSVAVDDGIESVAKKCGADVFRGSEEDVLERFIGAAYAFGLDGIIRVCGDNPFLLSGDLDRLIEKFRALKPDYMSFRIHGRPSILTHLGLWAEAVKVSALERVKSETKDAFFHEHVTNYIYTHEDTFNIEWILNNDDRFVMDRIRLTIDTQDDFQLAAIIYADLAKSNKNGGKAEDIFAYLDKHPEMIDIMKRQITGNRKE